MSRFLEQIFPAAMMRGFSEGTRHYGALLDHLEVVVIHSFMYTCARPVGAPKGAKGPPPRLVFEVLRRIHPEVRRRIQRATVVFRDRIWRADLERWDAEVKPSMLAEADALRREDLARLTTPQLSEHVRRAAAFLDRAVATHHRFNPCILVPLGDFLAHTIEWTGLPAGEILQTLRGLSPMSAGAVDELAALRSALAGDPDAVGLLRSNQSPAAVIEGLRARPEPVGGAVRAYLEVVGLRCVGGYDVAEHHAREHPELLVSIMRTALDEAGRDDPKHLAAAAKAVARVRDRVPSAHQQQFDELLREAQLTYRVRDERVLFGDALAGGLARRAILEAGARLAARGRIADPTHLVDATPDEILALLDGKGPSGDELAARSRYRTEVSMDVAPANLGFAPSPPPPADWLPGEAARLQRAINVMLTLMFATPTGQAKGKHLKGIAASPGTHEGRARVILDSTGLPSVQSGEILVTPSTGPTFNVVLPLVSAIVTERGGTLSHAAIVAREYGIPAVVGCVGATTAVKTGMRVRVDGEKGELWILD